MKRLSQIVVITAVALLAGVANAAVEQLRVDSPHPYNNNMNEQYEVKSATGAQLTAIHFKYIEVEQGYDFVRIIDENGVTIETITGIHEDYTVAITGSRAFVQLETDYTVVDDGFSIDEIHILQPCFCPMVWAPACGANGTTYGNSCQASCEDVDVLYLGECEWREVTDTIESSHPYANNARLAFPLTPPENTPLIKIPFASFDLEQGYDFVRVFGGGEERGKYTGQLDPFEVIVPGPTASIVMNTDSYVVGDGFIVKGWSYLVTPDTSACQTAGGSCVLPKGGCNWPNYIDDSLDCLGFNQVCCMPPSHDPTCDDGTEPLCEMIPPTCDDGEILAYQDNCYRCVNPETCEPNPTIAEIGEACDGPDQIACVADAVCVDHDGVGNGAWGTCHGFECNGPEHVDCPTGKHCQLYWRHMDSWGWCAPGSEVGGMCAGFAGFQCIDHPDIVCDLEPGLVCLDDVADIAGTCTHLPETCPELDEPVCGCDGRTYENDCMRLRHNMGQDHDGPCDDQGGLGDPCGGIMGAQCNPGLICAFSGDYPDASGICEEAGTWHTREITVETPHPYNDNMNETYSISVVRAEQIRVHFLYFYLEDGYDHIQIEENPDLYWTGERDPFLTPAIDGDTLTIRFTSDYSVTEYGFLIDRVEYFR